ncbi:MAG TPA: tyrosine-type recombinase/integrase, partial [Bellilinea sp.]|nr:tyrosine-type recombinase/integrase [Bellilinea sp.]
MAELRHLKAYGRWSWMRIVYNFCVFRRRSAPTCFVPDPTHFPTPQQRACPYILTTQEIARILSETNALKAHRNSPLFPQVARIAIVLLYTTGMRRGELVKLTLGDYDNVERTLLVRETKFYKSRMLPLSDDAVVELEKYLVCRRRTGFPVHRDAPLLINASPRIRGYT